MEGRGLCSVLLPIQGNLNKKIGPLSVYQKESGSCGNEVRTFRTLFGVTTGRVLAALRKLGPAMKAWGGDRRGR